MCLTASSPQRSTAVAALVAQLAQLGSDRYPSAAPRLLKAARIATTGGITWALDGECYWVQSATDARTLYRVDLAAPSCTCPDFEHRQRACCHQLAVRLLKAASRLDLEYRLARDLDQPIPFTLTGRGRAAAAGVAS